MPRYREWDLACKVYVGNLGSSASKYEIENAFSKYGPLRNVWVARNPPGFAFVEFEDRRDAEDATRGLDGTRCCGTRIRVEMSSGRSRRDDRRRGGGSAGGGGSSSGGRGGGRYRIKSTATTTSRTSTSSSFNKNYKNNIFTYHNYCSFSTNFTTTSNKLNLISFNDNIFDNSEKNVNQQFFKKECLQNFDNNNFSYSKHHFQHHQKQLQEKPQHSTFINKLMIIVFIINTNTLNTTNTNVTTVLHIKFDLVFAVVIVINTYLTIVVVAIENCNSCPDVKCSKRSTIIRTATTSKITTTATTTTSAATASTVTTTIATTRISATSKSVLGQQAQDQHQRQIPKHLLQPSSLIPPLLPPQPP
ncbi:uncharacterized protein LOC120773984 isoform X1 [Bactrocera tryoni]|uniref:uncharacterized protein LOC120773984 isoform X1 n=1 Tax=Bactrocera tryoni TaxID=59916 RepID=UPI001A989F2E|nr:uncharacterized protein LOC120773984 isoform X1 [Bactrocera tryoni]XP_039959176.1 uncharacterized protein LOC120773984 isoform X1 [Bactrocera tryoni]